ncbi:hypothetical protein SLA2020_172340 [Shorea laevis]
MCQEQKRVSNGVVSEGQGLGSSEENESRVDDATARGAAEVQDGLEISQQQPQGPVICWERFLPIRSLKVLLVENDESTRNVVSALLLNCSYEFILAVSAAANGLQAWKILEDLTNHVDLVLTEVAMPVVSGLGLLSKITSHKSVKNIPVIMMSSDDSMGLVFNCLSKGAVDFLVKPIRNNELKNLWQHVWRRCHSSSGSGSESGTRSKGSTKSKCNDESENNTGSSDERDNGSDGLIVSNGSDNGSGTHSSWTKRTAEAEISQPISPSSQLPDAPDSSGAQAIQAKSETCGNQCVCISESKECQEEDEQNDDSPMGKDLEIGVKRNPALKVGHQCDCDNLSTHQPSKKQNGVLETDCKQLLESGQMEQRENMIGNDLSPNIISGIANCMNHKAGARYVDTPSGPSDMLYVKDRACCDPGEAPSFELTLKTLPGDGAGQNATNDDQNALRHSDSSTFSKYHTASSANQAPTRNVGSNSPLDTVDAQPNGSNQLFTVQHGYYHHPVEKMQWQQSLTETAFKCVAVTAMQCGSSNAFEGPIECNVVHYSVTGSGSGSNHGSNGPNGSSISPNAEQTNVESYYGVAGSSEAGDISVSISASGVDEGWAAQREAALSKFFQKRKERCFENKVQYQSRKKLAEQGPRAKGQFVRQTLSDSEEGRKDCPSSNVTSRENSCDSPR